VDEDDEVAACWKADTPATATLAHAIAAAAAARFKASRVEVERALSEGGMARAG